MNYLSSFIALNGMIKKILIKINKKNDVCGEERYQVIENPPKTFFQSQHIIYITLKLIKNVSNQF